MISKEGRWTDVEAHAILSFLVHNEFVYLAYPPETTAYLWEELVKLDEKIKENPKRKRNSKRTLDLLRLFG